MLRILLNIEGRAKKRRKSLLQTFQFKNDSKIEKFSSFHFYLLPLWNQIKVEFILVKGIRLLSQCSGNIRGQEHERLGGVESSHVPKRRSHP